MNTDTDLRLLIKAFRAISTGQIWIDNSKIKALVNYAEISKISVVIGKLSRKEREVVIIVSQGLTNKEIASQLYISEQTVKTHINNIFKKLNVSRRTQLVPFGIKMSLESICKYQPQSGCAPVEQKKGQLQLLASSFTG